MIRILFTLSMVVATFAIQAQSNLDSLFAVWKDELKPDSTRVKAYNKYIWDGFLFLQPDTAFILAEDLMNYAVEKNFLKAKLRGYNLQGISCALRGDYPKALDFFTQLFAIEKQLDDKKGMASAIKNIGLIHSLQSDFVKALNYHTQSLAISKQLDDKKIIGSSLNDIGIIYINQGDYTKALDFFTQSLAIYKQLDDQKGMANAIINIGSIYTHQDEYAKALEYYNQSLEVLKQFGDQEGIAKTLNNIGIIYSYQGEYAKAVNYYMESLAIQKQLNDQKGIAKILNNLGIINKDQGDYPKALDYYSQSLAIRKQLGDQAEIAGSLNNIGIMYEDIGDYPKALDYCKKGFDLALSIGVLETQRNGCKCLYDAYKALGKGNEALLYMEKIQVIDDSLNAEETAKKLQRMEFQKQVFADSIENMEKARLVAEAHKSEVRKKNKTRNILFGSGLLALLLAGGFYSRWKYVRKAKEVIEKEKDRSENLLLNILPADIAAELKSKGKAEARAFDMVSILFTDFKGFTSASENMSAQDLVAEINTCFEAFDGITSKYNIEKIKTIGDAYMAAGGLPLPTKDSVKNTVLAALEMQDFIMKRKAEMDAIGLPAFEMRVGIHTGPVVAGIVGVKKFQYDIWGDTVNIASRIESSGEVGKINISQATYELLHAEKSFTFESRGKIEVKGKGEVAMYFVARS